jgi:hypothetical protein
MSGSSHGITKHHFCGSRVGTSDKIKMLYTPAHLRQDTGKPVSARLVIPILVNLYRKTDPDSYRLVAWGPLADMFAKNLSQGKEMTFICDGSSYWGNVFYNDGTQAFQKDGRTPLQTRQSSFTIREFTWGADSNRTTQEEIHAGMQSGEGRRPAQWDIVGTPDNLTWKQMLEMRKQTFYQGGERFGYAQVVAPRYAAQILLGDQSKILRNYGQNAAAAAPNQAAHQTYGIPANQTAPLVNQVHNAFAPQPGTPYQNVSTPLPYQNMGTQLPPIQTPVQTGLPVYNAPVYNAPA